MLAREAAQRGVPGATMEQLTVDPRPGLEFVHNFILQPDPALALDVLAVGHVLAVWLGLCDVSGLPSAKRLVSDLCCARQLSRDPILLVLNVSSAFRIQPLLCECRPTRSYLTWRSLAGHHKQATPTATGSGPCG